MAGFKSGVRLGCVISPLLSNLGDEESNILITWNGFSHLKDEDFGVNQLKSKVMRMNARSRAGIIFKEKPLENILEFKYLAFLQLMVGLEEKS